MSSASRPPNENLRRDEAAARSAAVRTQSYALEIDFSDAADPAQLSYPVITQISLDATPGASTFLDYLGHSVQSVQINGVQQDLDTVVDGARIHLHGLAENNTVRIASRSLYSRSGEGVHRFVDPADGLTYLYSQNEPADCRRIFPCFDQPDLKARFATSITAPTAWHVGSNGALLGVVEADGANSTRRFAPTEPMSTYVATFLAGPYALWSDHYSGRTASGVEAQIPLGLMTRASLAPSMDAEEVFEITKRGLDWFHTHFDFAYPWGKYDQAFVPEYNLGAMENPGLVTFTEHYVFTSPATEAQHEQRANTILHEMCHMWFGDLVTMRWWDDLWLKESFADYVGTLAVDQATDFTTAWTTFASRRKAWAYRQDQFPTTHPIVADIVDLEAADQNFDGITYAKGASVLKQLSAFVGQDAFLAAARSYFRQHAWGNTTLDDFLESLCAASGRDMTGWAQAWLTTAGVSRLSLETQVGLDGRITAARLLQGGIDPRSGNTVLRPHVVRVGAYAPQEGFEPATLAASFEVRLDGDSVDVPELVGRPATEALLPNDEDLSYATLGLDPATLDTVLSAGLDDELARATALAAAWNLTRDGLLSPERFVDGVVANSGLIEDSGVLAQTYSQANTGLFDYTTQDTRQELVSRWVTFLVTQVLESPAPSDSRTVTLRSLMGALGHQKSPLPQVLDLVAAWIDDADFGLGEEMTWAALTALAAHGRVSAEDLQAMADAAPTAVSQTGLSRALAARPDAAIKREARQSAYRGTDQAGAVLSNDQLQATLDGYAVDPTGISGDHDAEYWDRIEELWARQSQGQATRVVTGLFPGDGNRDLGDETTHPQVLAAKAWLRDQTGAPQALRRLVLEGLDDLERRLFAQGYSARAAQPGGEERDLSQRS